MTYRIACFCLALTASGPLFGETAVHTSLPVEPIRPAAYDPWQDALHLSNAVVNLVILPRWGRIVSLSFGNGSNLLYTAGSDGGEELRRPADLPGDTAWTANAWLCTDGEQHVRMHAELSDGVEIAREIDLMGASLKIRQRVSGLDGRVAPRGLHQVCGIRSPIRIVIPVGPASAFDEGYALVEAEDGQHVLNRCAETVVLDCAFGGRYAVGSDSPRGWLAAELEQGLLLVKVGSQDGDATLADGTCRLQAVNDRPSGYAELHTAGPSPAGADETAGENSLEISLHPLPGALDDCGLAAFAHKIASEQSAPVAARGADPSL